jgi:diadenylate cyclase
VQEVFWVISNITPAALVDITIVALVFFALTLSFRGRQAATLLRGIVILFVSLFVVATLLRLQGLSWLLNNTFTALIVAIPLIFQNEIRALFERIGRGRLLFTNYAPEDVRNSVVDEIVKATEKLTERRHGALIVLQRYSGLEEFITTGIRVESIVKSELLLTIFWPKTELHDGAVIITREGVLASAAAVLPLTASRNLPTPKTGTRHRAAVGISEVTDATCVVVSEETGRVSVAQNGRLIMKVESERLRAMLLAAYEDSFGERPSGLRASLRAWWRARQAKLQAARGT